MSDGFIILALISSSLSLFLAIICVTYSYFKLKEGFSTNKAYDVVYEDLITLYPNIFDSDNADSITIYACIKYIKQRSRSFKAERG